MRYLLLLLFAAACHAQAVRVPPVDFTVYYGTADEVATTGSLNLTTGNAKGVPQAFTVKHDGASGTANLFVRFDGTAATVTSVAAAGTFPTASRSFPIKAGESVSFNGRPSSFSYIRDTTGSNADFEFRLITGR